MAGKYRLHFLLFFGAFILSTSALYADPEPQPISLREALTSLSKGAPEKASFVTLSEAQIRSFRAGIKHTILNALSSKGYLEIGIERLKDTDPDMVRIYRGLMEESGKIEHLLAPRLKELTSDQFIEKIKKMREVAIKLFRDGEKIKDARLRSIWHKSTQLIVNVVELTYRSIQRRPQEMRHSILKSVLLDFWVLEEMARDKEFRAHVHRGSLFSHGQIYRHYLVERPAEFLTRFSLLSFLMDFESNKGEQTVKKRFKVEDGKIVIQLPYHKEGKAGKEGQAKKNVMPWHEHLRAFKNGSGWHIALAKAHLETQFSAKITYSETAGVIIELPIEKGKGVGNAFGASLSVTRRPFSLMAAAQQLQSEIPNEQLLTKTGTRLAVERMSFDFLKEFPDPSKMSSEKITSFFERHVMKDLIDMNKVSGWADIAGFAKQAMPRWNRALVVDIVRSFLKEARRPK